MKTKEQIQQELNTYLTKTSQHVFVVGENKKFLRVVETTTKDGEQIWFSVWLDENLEPKEIDRWVDISSYSDPNSKCWVKHSLFLNRDMKSVKLKKKTQWIADSLVETMKGLSKPPINWNEVRAYKENLLSEMKIK